MENKTKVLIVDDDEDTLNYLGIYLKDSFELMSARSVHSGMRAFETFRPKVVITDLRMPGGDGDLLVRKITRNYPETLVVLMSGVGDCETASQGFREGIFDYLEKPLSKEKIHNLMDSAIQVLSMKDTFRSAGAREILKKKKVFAKDVGFYLSLRVEKPLERIEEFCRQLETEMGQTDVNLDLCRDLTEKISDQGQIVRDRIAYADYPVQIDKEKTPVDKLIKNVLCMEKEKFNDGGVNFTVDGLADELYVDCHNIQVSQVLNEILDKAYTGALESSERWVQMHVEEMSGYVEFVVKESRLTSETLLRSQEGRPLAPPDIENWSYYLRSVVEDHNGYLFVDEESEYLSVVLRIPLEYQGEKRAI